MDGVVLRRDGEVGEIVETGQVLFRVGVPKPLQVVAEVNEEDIPRVALGQKVLLRTDAFAGKALEGTVHEITPAGRSVAKTFRIRVALPDDTPLKVGMSVEANVVTREKPGALLVPADAVQGTRFRWSRATACAGARSRSASAAHARSRSCPGWRRMSGSPRPPPRRSPTATRCGSRRA